VVEAAAQSSGEPRIALDRHDPSAATDEAGRQRAGAYVEDQIAAPDAGSIEQISGDSRIGEKVRSWGIRRPASTAGHGRP